MKKFEYKKIDVYSSVLETNPDLMSVLNTAGAEGWELMFKDDHWVYLKREIIKSEKELLFENLPQ